MDGMNKEFIILLTSLTEFSLFLPKYFVNEVIIMETNRRNKGSTIEFDKFLQFISILMSIIAKHDTGRMKCFSETPIDIFVGC